MNEPGIDYPEVDGEAQVALPGHGVTVSSRVESVDGDLLTLRPSIGDYVDQDVVVQGSLVELLWQRPQDQRAAPADVVSVEPGSVLRWRVRLIGPAEVVQRRQSVRAKVLVPVHVGLGIVDLEGESSDLSEHGVRVGVDGFGLRPEPGDPVDLRIELESGPVDAKGEVVRVVARGPRWFLSTRFVGLEEKEGDRIRRRVFQALREERARLAY